MKKIFAFAALAALSVSFAAAGCKDKSNTQYTSQGYYYTSMATTASLVVSDDFTSEKRKEAYNSLVEETGKLLQQVNSSLSATVSTSSVSVFNNAQAGEKVEIDYTSYTVLNKAIDVYEMTDGYYNPAVYYSVYAYGFNRNAGFNGYNPETDFPSAETVEKYTELASHFGETETSEENGKYYAKKPSATVEADGATLAMKIDLGGIGKGYAVDLVNSLFDKYGFKYGNFSFGTSSIVCRQHHVSGDYQLGLFNPRYEVYNETFGSLPVKDKCLSTSGDYESYWYVDGVMYCHIIDPTTGSPIRTGIMSATVIGGNACEADALTTAIMAMGRERAVQFINDKLSDKQVLFTYDNNGEYQLITNISSDILNLSTNKIKLVNTLSDDGKIILGENNVA